MYIDSHQHFWILERGDYSWMSPDFKPIYRDFMPRDLAPLIEKRGINKTIIVQAADTVAETDFTLKIADETDFVAGVVGWVDFQNPNVIDEIDRLASNKYLRGFRPMIHDIDDHNWMLRDDIQVGIDYLIKKKLTFDALVRPQHLKNLIIFAKKYDELRIVIDHIAKPRILSGEIFEWQNNMRELSLQENVYCKFSGILTEIGKDYDRKQILPYVNFIFEIFDSSRVMWGSDWPVLNMAEDYCDWFDLAMDTCNGFSESEKMNIFSKTAEKFYGINLD